MFKYQLIPIFQQIPTPENFRGVCLSKRLKKASYSIFSIQINGHYLICFTITDDEEIKMTKRYRCRRGIEAFQNIPRVLTVKNDGCLRNRVCISIRSRYWRWIRDQINSLTIPSLRFVTIISIVYSYCLLLGFEELYRLT